MPWPTATPMSQRLEFVQLVVRRQTTIREACRQFHISEKTGYKWLDRYARGGPAALADRSHAPVTPPHQVARAIVDAICAERERNPTWGARKLRAVLRAEQPEVAWPAASTMTILLKRAGLIVPRRRRIRDREAWATAHLTTPASPNDVWAADFKGEFRLRTGPYCYPLTVSDLQSRYVLACTALASTAADPVQAAFIGLFTTYGLPRVIRTDNGIPFGAPNSLGSLSRLGVWWIRLGIRPERIRKGEPQENAEHERMHRTLKADATRPPRDSLDAQQRAFDHWRRMFNERRPHEALGMTPPAQHYTRSARPYPTRRLPTLEYAPHLELRRVAADGSFKWRSDRIFLSQVLANEDIALDATGDGEWTLSFGPLQLGRYSAHRLAFEPDVGWTPRPDANSSPSTT